MPRHLRIRCKAAGALARRLLAALALPAIVHAATAPGTVITNVVEARWTAGNNPASVTAQHQLTIPPYAIGADLALTKVGPAQASAGGEIVWKLVVRNAGSTAANGAQLTDIVPPQVNQVAAACSVLTGGSCGAVSVGTPTAAGTPVTVAIANLAAGGQIEVTVRGTVSAGSGTLSNQASVGIPGVIDPTPADNTAQAATQLVPSANQFASLRGVVWLDLNHDRVISAGEPLLAGYTVRLYAPDGTTVVAETRTDASGAYAFGKLPAGVAYQLEFRDPSGLLALGVPVAADGSGDRFAATAPCGQKAAATQSGMQLWQRPGGTCYSLTEAGSSAEVLQSGRTLITLQGGDSLAEQSLPLEPSGVVYDAVTRQPVAGAAVALQGPAGFDPAQHLLGGARNARQVTEAGGAYQFVLLAGAPRGVYELKIEPPAQYTAPSKLLPPAPTLDPTGLGSNGVYLVQPQAAPPPAGAVTTYHLALDLAPGDPQVLNNHLPLDPSTAGGLLTLTKSVNRAVAAIGDPVQYRLRLANTGAATLTQIEIADRLPPGFSYSSGSLRIDDAPAADPKRSADGRTLSILLPKLAAGATADIRYVATIGSGASAGPAVNVAVAGTAGGLRTPPARATVAVEEDLFRRRIVLLGRVIAIESCTEKDAAGNERDVDFATLNSGRGIANARIYLQDGSTIRTDDEGKWHADGVRAGTHVVQLDVDSLPPGYEPVACKSNTRRAGRRFSQFVNAPGGTLARADFYVRATVDGGRPAQAGQRLTVTPGADGARLMLQVKGTATVDAVTATFMLPAGVELAADNARLDGKPLPLERNENMVTARLGARRGDWSAQLELDLRGRPTGNATVRAATQVRTGHATHPLPMVQTEIGATASTSAPATVEFKATAPAAPVTPAEDRDSLEGTNKLYAAGAEKFDAEWLATVEPGFEIVFPPPGFNPGVKAAKVMVKHTAAQRVELQINGEPVHALNRDRSEGNISGTVALSRWGGVPLRDGTNRLLAIAFDGDGREVARAEREIRYAVGAVEARLLPQESMLIADGRTAPVIALAIVDADGEPARPGIDGTVRIGAPYMALNVARMRDARPLLDDPGNEPRWRVGADGIARIRLEPTTTSGEVVLTFNFPGRAAQEIRARLAPELRDWILVGFAEGTAGFRSLKGNLETLTGSDAEDNLYSDGQIAFYAKGRVSGDWLLTMAYDNKKERSNRGGNFGDRLGQAFQPNAYYSIYGDATSVQYDAASVSKLYLKIEREQFYAMFGDFDTGLTVTELSRYSRTLNGIKSEYQGESLSYSAFAARTTQAFVRDELRGDGTSGAYKLSRDSVLANTDNVVLETRDRFRPEVVLASRPLSRGIDYDIDYSAGTIWFFRAQPSRDQAFNPIFIVVDYESEDASRDEKTTAGGRAAVRFAGNRAELGVTAVRQGSGVPGDLGGADLTVNLDEKTRVRGEVAQTRRDADALPGVVLPERANGYLVEVRRQDKDVAATAYVRSEESGFGLGQQRQAAVGMTRAGGDVSLRLSDRLRLNALGYKERVEAPLTSAERILAEGRLNFGETNYDLYAGARWLHEQNLKGDELDSSQLVAGGAYRLLGGALNLRLDAELVAAGSKGSPDYPQRLRLGADYRLTDTIGLFADQEFTYGAPENTATTRVGVRTTPWLGAEASSSVNLGVGPNGASTSPSVGLMQNLRVSEWLTFSFGVDRTDTLRGPATPPLDPRAPSAQGIFSLVPATVLRPLEDYTSVFAGMAYNQGPWGATLRAENRNGATVDRTNFAATVHRDLSLGEALAATALYSANTLADNETRRLDLRLSYARRPVASRWVLLNRFDYVQEEIDRPGSSRQSRRLVDNFNANWQPRWGTQLSLQLGVKYALDSLDGTEASGFTDLLGAELRQDIGSRLDVGLRAAQLQTWRSDTRLYSYGLSVGTWPLENLWLGVGYNFAGFRDSDFSGAGNTAQGWYLFFRFKFDQATGDVAAQRRLMFDEAAR
jgi:uncharacterized repeat protein (TIGR01451 family)